MQASTVLDFFDPESNPLGSKGLGDLVEGVAISARSAELFTQVVLSQDFDRVSVIDADFVPDIKGHARDLRHHARLFLDTVQPQILSAYVDVASFANFVEAVCDVLDGPGPLDPGGAIELVNALVAEAGKRRRSAQDLTVLLDVLGGQLRTDRDDLADDLEDAEQAVLDENGAIAALNDDVVEARADARAASAALAGAIVGAGASAAVITIGVLAELEPVEGIGLVVTGVLGAVASTGAIIGEGVALADANKRLRDAYEALRVADFRIALLRAVEAEAENLDQAFDAAVNEVCATVAAWSRITADLEAFREELRGAGDSITRLRNIVKIARTDWRATRADALAQVALSPKFTIDPPA